jgi:hypothetical protein
VEALTCPYSMSAPALRCRGFVLRCVDGRQGGEDLAGFLADVGARVLAWPLIWMVTPRNGRSLRTRSLMLAPVASCRRPEMAKAANTTVRCASMASRLPGPGAQDAGGL